MFLFGTSPLFVHGIAGMLQDTTPMSPSSLMSKFVVLSLGHFVFDEPSPRLLESAALGIRRFLVDPSSPSPRSFRDLLHIDAEPLLVFLAAVIAVPRRLEMVELNLEKFLGDFNFCELDRDVGVGRLQFTLALVLFVTFELVLCETQFHKTRFFENLKEVDDSVTLAWGKSFLQSAFEFAVQVVRDDMVRFPWSWPGFC